MIAPIHQTDLHSLPLLHRGKVRDIYAAGDDHLLIVTTDRLSAFDVILRRPIPGKGRVLTELTEFWMQKFSDLLPNQMAPDQQLSDFLSTEELAPIQHQTRIVRKLHAIPVECVVRGYLIGSGWKDYQRSGEVCGIGLPKGLLLADQLPEPIFTPADKAPVGQHDENIAFGQMCDKVGSELAHQLQNLSLEIYARAAAHAKARGIIVADTKFEFGLDDNDKIHLIDEVLTPDSSRFWAAETWMPGTSPPSFDKQIVRDWLEAQEWDKSPPGPELPDGIADKTATRYIQVQELLMR